MTLQRKPEWSFQAWADKFLHAVVLEPREIRGFDKAGAARSVQAWAAAKARGIKDGSGDHLVTQGGPLRLMWVECKRPDGKGKPSDAQLATADAYAKCDVPTVFAHNIHQILDGLRSAGIRVSANAGTVACVYQEHVNASERTREAAVLVKRSTSKPRAPRATPAQIKRAHKAGVWR